MASAGIGSSVEGLHAVLAAARAGRVNVLHIERPRLAGEQGARIASLVEESGGRVVVVDDVLGQSGAPQGVRAEAKPVATVDIRTLTGAGAALVLLDHLEDARNVGAIARSAQAAGMTGLVVSSRRSAPLEAPAFKAAAGALESLPVAIVSSIPKAMGALEKDGVWTVGLDAQGDQSLFGLALLTEPVALVIGAEGSGLARLTAERCDVLVKIPMASASESLNASVAASLAMFEVARVRTRAAENSG